MFCPKCGSELREGASFCPKCGTKIENRTESATAPVKRAPEFQEIKKNLPEMKQGGNVYKEYSAEDGAGIAAAVVILVMAVSFLGRPNMKNLDTEKLTKSISRISWIIRKIIICMRRVLTIWRRI